MNNDLLKASFSVGHVEIELEVTTNNSVTCSSCQKCKHTTEESQELLTTVYRVEDA